jgi:hypothetical protein
MMTNYFVYGRALYRTDSKTFSIFNREYEEKNGYPNAAWLCSNMNEALEEMNRLNHQ